MTINKRIVTSAMTIGTAGALLVGATFAFFTDTSTSNNNVFSAGTLSLVVTDSDQVDQENIVASFGGSNLLPGQTVNAGFVELENSGSAAIAEIELLGVTTETLDPDPSGDIASLLNMTVLTGTNNTCSSGQTDLTGTLATALGNGLSPLTLAELGSSVTYDALPGLAAGTSYFLCMTATLDSGAGNEVQGDAAEIDLTFTANQDASQ